jgi:hypothetical protein
VRALWRLVRHGQQPVRSQRLRLAFRLDVLERPDLDGAADKPDRFLAEQDLARRRALLEPRGDDDRVPGGQALGRPGHDLARIDADPQGERGPVVAGELLVQLRDGLANPGRCAHGAQGVVLVHDGHAEDGEDGVADELLDRAAVPLDHGLRRLEVAGERRAQALRVESFSQRGRAGDVALEHRDRLALLAGGWRDAQRGTAGVAEPRPLAVLGPARRARHHEQRLRQQRTERKEAARVSTLTPCSSRPRRLRSSSRSSSRSRG